MHSSRTCVICNLDSISLEVYVEFNLIEARAAAILTPHLMRHAPAVFLDAFPVSSHVIHFVILMIGAGKNGWVLNKLFEDRLLRQVFAHCRNAACCVWVCLAAPAG